MSVSSSDLVCVGCACAFIAKPKAEAASESGGLGSRMRYQLGGGPMLVCPGDHVNVESMRDKCVSAMCFASEHKLGQPVSQGPVGR